MNLELNERPRRLRRSEAIREMVRETQTSPAQLILPLFLVEGRDVRREVPSMPGVHQLSVDRLLNETASLEDLGIRGVILFGVPDRKDEEGSGAWDRSGAVQRGIEILRKERPGLVVISDVCLCEYTSHGHCGVLDGDRILNDESVERLVRVALSHADAGADMVAPSDMMDGRVGAIRSALDRSGYHHTGILSYAVKYASAFYGPFRDAAESTPSFGDRKSHQMDPANGREAMREARLDLEEGADMLMVKPAVTNLDIIRQLRDTTDVPLAAYHVSGEYSMIHAAARNGWLDLDRAMMESLLSIRRAGADMIVTYYAREAARLLAP